MDWSGKPVLVTGAGGFIGSHLTERLLELGASVRALVHYNAMSSPGWLAAVPDRLRPGLEIAFGDVRDSDSVHKAMAGREAVLHLAALISVPYSFEAPRSFLDTNVAGALNILSAANAQGARVVIASSSEVYGTPTTTPITEAHPLQAHSPYAASKIAADKFAESFHHSYGTAVTVLRPFNTYGPRQSTRAVLPVILSQLLSGEPKVRLGSLHPQRDLTFVDDTVAGFVKAVESDRAIGETIQLGTGRTTSIGDLVELAARLLNVEFEIETEEKRVRPADAEVEVLLSDPAAARELLGWEPTVSLEDGIIRTAEWMKSSLGESPTAQYVV